MFINRLSQLTLILQLLILLGLLGCEYKGPTEIWNPDKAGGIDPIITEIIPEAMAQAGINEIKIIGQNFSPLLEENLIYVGGVKVPLKSAAPTELSFYRPKFTGDSLTIKLVAPAAYQIAEYYPYSIEKIGDNYGELGNLDYLYAFDLDADENIIAHDRTKYFLKVPRNGVKETLFKTKIRRMNDLKVGPGGAWYIADKKNRITVVTPDNPNGTSFGVMRGNLTNLDFDQAGNIYTSGIQTGLFVLRPDTTTQEYPVLLDYEVSCVRVFDNHVYISGDYVADATPEIKTGIWRLPILDNTGQLGDLELVLNWSDFGAKADTTLLIDFTFAANGVMYIATDGGPSNTADPIFMRYPDGTLDIFYPGGLLIGPTGLTGPIDFLIWGNDEYLYFWRGGNSAKSRRMFRLKMSQPGAPYYGRYL